MQEKFAGTIFLYYLCRRKRETEGNKKYMSQKTDVFCDIVFCAAGLRLQCAKQGGIIDISLLPAEDLK
ncbi:MAG: hypothetical protein II970_08370 [Paludibacteraceae bacterium]|nr:hypothetical protein [Paludibacteraceae bacterium]